MIVNIEKINHFRLYKNHGKNFSSIRKKWIYIDYEKRNARRNDDIEQNRHLSVASKKKIAPNITVVTQPIDAVAQPINAVAQPIDAVVPTIVEPIPAQKKADEKYVYSENPMEVNTDKIYHFKLYKNDGKTFETIRKNRQSNYDKMQKDRRDDSNGQHRNPTNDNTKENRPPIVDTSMQPNTMEVNTEKIYHFKLYKNNGKTFGTNRKNRQSIYDEMQKARRDYNIEQNRNDTTDDMAEDDSTIDDSSKEQDIMEDDTSTTNHSKLYKNYGKNFDAIRKNRQTTNIELRKSRRDDNIQKKRNMTIPTDIENDATFPPSSPVTAEEIQLLVQECSSNVPDVYHKAILRLRLYLTMENVPYMDELLNLNIVDICAARLSANESVEVRYNATWALTNIASGPTYQTQYLLKPHIISALGSLLLEPYPNLVEQSTWALSNIIGDGSTARSFVLNLNLLSCLQSVLAANLQNRAVVKQLSWMLINICRKKEAELEIRYLPLIIPLLDKLLDYQDEMILSDILWAITHLADSSHSHISLLIQGGIVDKILNFFSYSPKIALSALRSVGNVAASIDEHTQYLINKNIYSYIQPLFQTTNQKIKKEVYWLLSNIAAGTRPQMLTLFQLNIFSQILHDLEFGEYQIQREACWVIANVLHTCTISEAQPFIDSRVLINMNKFLTATDVSMIIVVLEVILILLKLYNGGNQLLYICEKIEESGALDSIEALQSHPNKTIYSFSAHILEKYFSEDESTIANNHLVNPPSGIKEELNKNNVDQTKNDYNF